jgi:PAS domain S-box-containing protein
VPERPALVPSAGASARWPGPVYAAVALAGGLAMLAVGGVFLAAGPWTRWAGAAGALALAILLAGHVRALLRELGEHERRSRDLRGSEALLTGLFEACPDVITVTDPATGRYVMANPRFEEIIGYRVDEVLGRTVLELGLLPDQAERERLLNEVRRQGRIVNFPMRYRARDGRTVNTELSGTFFTVGQESYLLVVSHDVTERQRIQAEYRAIFDNASVGIALVRHGRLRQVNERFERMLGWAIRCATSGPVPKPSRPRVPPRAKRSRQGGHWMSSGRCGGATARRSGPVRGLRSCPRSMEPARRTRTRSGSSRM